MIVSVLILGGEGRLGAAIRTRVESDPALGLAGVVGRRSRDVPYPYSVHLGDALVRFAPDVVVDAAPGPGLGERLDHLAARPVPIVLGSTGYPDPLHSRLEALSRERAVVLAPNFSPGAAALEGVLRALRPALDTGVWDASILDRHHRAKADRPSGTAKALARRLWEEPPEEKIVSVRQGDVVGEHIVFLSGRGEELVLRHQVTDRAVFAGGAALAAAFAYKAGPGLWTMAHVLGLSDS